MKRTTLLIAALTLISGASFGAINLELRGDYNSVGAYKNSSDTDVSAQSYFDFKRGKLKFTGNVNDNVSYKLRFGVDKLPGDAVSSTANGKMVVLMDYAEITHKIADMFSLTVGQLADSNLSAWEGQTSAADYYFHTSNGASTAYYYPNLVGMKFDIDLGGHNVYVYAADPSYSGSYSYRTNAQMGYGLAYKGWLMDKSLGLIANYFTTPGYKMSGSTITGSDSETATNYMAVGAQYKMDALLAELDYLSKTELKAAGNDSKVTSSILAKVKYQFGNWSPFLHYDMGKIVKSSVTVNSATVYGDTAINQFALGVEFKPQTDSDFRYHLAYASKTTTYPTEFAYTKSSVAESKIMFGVKMAADIVK